MSKLTIYALTIRALLEDIHPTAPWLALSLGAWATVYAWRKLLPGLWLKLETLDKPLSVAIGALPSVIMTTAVGALTMGKDPWVLVGASLMGVGAPLLHHLLKALPISYQGQPAAKESLVTRRTMLLIVLFGQPGCVAQQSPAPKYTPEELLCIADAEAVKIKAFGACKPCSDEQIDAIMDTRKAAGQSCYLGAK